jgi:predicted O-linked N-acetylglucosamine transferase (SPINDLY family)
MAEFYPGEAVCVARPGRISWARPGDAVAMAGPKRPIPTMPPDPPPQGPPGAAAPPTVAQVLQRALASCQRGQWPEAERLCRMALDAAPEHFDALHLLGSIALQTRRLPEAAEWLTRALAVEPRSVAARTARAGTLLALGRDAEALEDYDGALASAPGSAEVHYNRGLILHRMGRHEQAREAYGRAIAARPGFAAAHNNLGVVLRDLGDPAQALECHDRAIALDPASAEAHNNRGVVLRELRRHGDALRSYQRALESRPGFAQAHFNAGNALADLGRHEEALQCQDRAIALEPGYVDAHVRRGIALRDLGRRAEAVESYARARALDPDFEWLEGLWLNARMQVCDWADLSRHVERLAGKVERGERAAHPFPLLAMPGTAAVQRKAAETWVQARHPQRELLPAVAMDSRRERIRVGYFSADFFEHATSYLVAELLERHDRAAFEVSAFSFGPDTRDAMRVRVAGAVERFVDVRGQSDGEVARLARGLGIDIAVDLKGFTEDSRTGIFALRAAPIQVNFLGYPGTMGAPYIDYLVADATVVPEGHEARYAERIVRLPDSYQPNDSKRRIAERAFTREEAGLPAAGFVFCSFNNNYKIVPATFDIWMRLLGRVEGSVLWLLQDNEQAAANLRAEAARRGIDPGRLVFAKRLPLDEHLARHRLADLFLDTLPYNAHTTASDALWAGLPLLTCLGETFAGRVAASLLRAAGLPELVTATPEAYEALAMELATDAGRLGQLRRRLAENRLEAPLFDARRFARHLESAYARMVERYRAGLPPEHIRVPT